MLLTGLALWRSALVILMYVTIVGRVHQAGRRGQRPHAEALRVVLFGYGHEAVLDTAVLAAVATPIAGVLGVVIAFLVVRQLRGRGWLDFGEHARDRGAGDGLRHRLRAGFNRRPTFGITVLPNLVGGPAVFGGALAIVLSYVFRGAGRPAHGAARWHSRPVDRAGFDLAGRRSNHLPARHPAADPAGAADRPHLLASPGA